MEKREGIFTGGEETEKELNEGNDRSAAPFIVVPLVYIRTHNQ